MLTLKQLKEVINDMYVQKQKYDQKCGEARMPKETMEQYMYIYLNRKYGLKNLIIEQVVAIVNGIKIYQREDHEVMLFGKILKNDCDEEFHVIQTHVKDTLVMLMKALIRERHPLKQEADINLYMDQIQKGYVDEWIWRKIIEKMYDSED